MQNITKPVPRHANRFSEITLWSAERRAEFSRRVAALTSLGRPRELARAIAFDQLQLYGRPRRAP